jgi:uncharacterized protein (DUF2342 family)
MAGFEIHLDPAGLAEILTKNMRGPVDDAAANIAANVDVGSVTEAKVSVRSGVTDDMRINRARATVTIAHPAGLAMQAKHGTLTKAAAAAGLTVKGKT